MSKALLSTAILVLAAFAPPAGRPPVGPLHRIEPRVYDIKFDVTVLTHLPGDVTQRETMALRNTPIAFPLIFQGTYSRVDRDSLRGRLWKDGMEDEDLSSRTRIDEDLPFHTDLAIMTVDAFQGASLQWRIGFRTQVWSSRIDEAGAARLTWPQAFPEEVEDGLKPQLYIESSEPIFKETVERVSQGRLRLVPPYHAAKELVRYCVNEVQVTGDGMKRGEPIMRGRGGVVAGVVDVLRGMEVQGALKTAQSGRGGPHDLVCVCIAMLRAAGIPARAVIGIHEDAADRTEFVSWGEFYLPDAGWIPFDPNEMRGKNISGLQLTDTWPAFGTVDELNERVPLAFHFVPPVAVSSPEAPAVWGWDPQPRRPRTAYQRIVLGITSRGAGTPDPQ